MTPQESWNQFVNDAWMRGGRALFLATAVGILASTQQYYDYPIWKLAAASFVMALPRRTFPIIVFMLIILIILTLVPPAAVTAFAEFLHRLRG